MSVIYKKKYADVGFSNMVNCNFPKKGDLDSIVYTWQSYSDSIAAHPNWFPFNYLNNSYHRDTDMENMQDCATTLLLAPGIAQIFYGDETGRPLSDARLNVDSAQAFRSDMNWDSTDKDLLRHFQKLAHIRKAHPAIGSGKQTTLDSHTCVRSTDTDTILIHLKPTEGEILEVSPYFKEDETLIELYSGEKARVKDGKVSFPSAPSNVWIISKTQ